MTQGILSDYWENISEGALEDARAALQGVERGDAGIRHFLKAEADDAERELDCAFDTVSAAEHAEGEAYDRLWSAQQALSAAMKAHREAAAEHKAADEAEQKAVEARKKAYIKAEDAIAKVRVYEEN